MTAIIYWSGTGNTEEMAEAILEGMEQGGAEVALFSVDQVDFSIINEYDKFAFGCPSMGDETLEEDEFEPFFSAIEEKLANKKVALFGSYGWGDGQWMRDWEKRVNAAGAFLFAEGLIINESEEKDNCISFGQEFALF